jgi:hypothetical protein
MMDREHAHRDARLRPLAPPPARGARPGAPIVAGLLAAALLAVAGVIPAAAGAGGPAGVAPPAGCADGTGCGTPCYGAAARDPEHQPCVNPALDRLVTPSPDLAELEIGDRCATKEREANWWVCAFGPVVAPRTFALIGDSHAGHWRGALANLAGTEGWRGISITRAGCPFSTAVPALAPPLDTQCVAWNHRVLRWFAAHPEVDLVFVSEHSGAGFVTRRGQDPYATKVAGYAAALRALPRTVRHVIVLRDTPLNTSNSFACVSAAIARHERAGLVCAVPRRHALAAPDADVAAAARVRPARVRVLDLTRFFCSSRFCFPVIGGVLVHRDIDHMTPEFSTTLGPFIRRQLTRWMASPAWAV